MHDRHPESILHVDMDAFFASVEQRDDPSLRGLPVAVGAASGRGVVAAASYEARRFGVHSAMPMVQARGLCPDLVGVGHHFERYREVSRAVRAIFADVTPVVEPLSLDEAFLDVAGAVHLYGEPPVLGEWIRGRVRDELDLPCSVGVGPTKSVAKLLSGLAKPDGLLHWPAGEVVERLRPLDVSALWGAGPRTAERLRSFGLRTVGDVADADASVVQRIVGDVNGRQLHRLARGEDPRRVTPRQPARSVSAETTFDVDVDDPDELRRHVLRLAGSVGRRLRRQGIAGRTVTLKLRFDSFETVTRSTTRPTATDRTHDLVTAAGRLLADLRLERVRVRLVGVGVSNFGDGGGAEQLALVTDDVDTHRWGRVERVADRVAERFDGVDVSYAALLDDLAGEGPDPDLREEVAEDLRPQRPSPATRTTRTPHDP